MKKIQIFAECIDLTSAIKLQEIGLIRICSHDDDFTAVIPNSLDGRQLYFDLRENNFLLFKIDYGDHAGTYNVTREMFA